MARNARHKRLPQFCSLRAPNKMEKAILGESFDYAQDKLRDGESGERPAPHPRPFAPLRVTNLSFRQGL